MAAKTAVRTGGGPAPAGLGVPRAGDGARRAAIWIMVVGLPLAYEFSGRLAGPRNFYGGDAAYWFSGLQVKLVLMAVGALALAMGLRRSDGGLAAIGWPVRCAAWQIALMAATLLGALALALFYQPPAVSSAVYGVTASIPVGTLERLSLVGVALADALVQESIWRGAVIAWLRPYFGNVLPPAMSVASFLLFHPAFGWQWGRLVLLLPLTLFYTLVVIRRGSILPAVYVHFVLAAGQLLAPVAR